MSEGGEKATSSLHEPNAAFDHESSQVPKTEKYSILCDLCPFSLLHQDTILQSQWNK